MIRKKYLIWSDGLMAYWWGGIGDIIEEEERGGIFSI